MSHDESMAPTDEPWDVSLALSALDGDQALLIEIVQIFIDALQTQEKNVQVLALSRDFRAIRMVTHMHLPTLKMLGFQKIARVFEAFESAALMNDQEGCQRLAEPLAQAWRACLDQLRAFMQTRNLRAEST